MIGSSGKGRDPLKYVVRDLINNSGVWKKFDWERRNHFVCPTCFRTEISQRFVAMETTSYQYQDKKKLKLTNFYQKQQLFINFYYIFNIKRTIFNTNLQFWTY